MAIIGSRQGGTGYTNVSKLINANQQQPGMGSSIVSGIQKAGQTAQDAYKKEKTGFEAGAIGVTDEQKNKTSSVINNAASGGLKEDPSTQASEIGDAVNQIKTNTSGYHGPMGLTGEGQGAASKAAAMSHQGTGQLLQGQYGKLAGYNPALRRFDTTLVNRSPELQNIRQAQAGISGAGEQYNRLAGYASDRGQQLTQEHEGFKQQVYKDIADRLGKTNTDIDTQLATEKSNADATAARIKEKIKSGGWADNDPDLQLLKSSGLDLNSASGAMTKDDLANYLESKSGNLTRTNVMNESQANALRALNAISGKNYGDIDVGIEDASKIGQKGSAIGFNGGLGTYTGQVGKEITDIENQYSPQLNDARTQANYAIQQGMDLGVNYKPGEDYNMALNNEKMKQSTVARQMQDAIQKAQATGGSWDASVYGDNPPPATQEEYLAMAKAKMDEANAKVGKLNNTQNQFLTNSSKYSSLYNEAKGKVNPYLTGSGNATRYQTLANLMGLNGKGVPSSGTFLTGYDPNNIYTETTPAYASKKLPG